MAIAFDASGGGYNPANSGPTLTYAHVCTGNNLILFAAVWGTSGNAITNVKYNGALMALIDTQTQVSGSSPGYFVSLYYLLAPTTGTNNVVITYTGNGSCLSYSESYTGVKQSNQPDNHAAIESASTASFTQLLTVNTINSWIIWAIYPTSDLTMTAGANTLIRQAEYVHFGAGLADTNVMQSSGSQSMNVTSSAQVFEGIIASFSPAVTIIPNLPLLRVG